MQAGNAEAITVLTGNILMVFRGERHIHAFTFQDVVCTTLESNITPGANFGHGPGVFVNGRLLCRFNKQ
jgi:hypothetical protein